MGGNNLIKKGMVVAVILLFVSVSFIPSTGTTDVKQITVSTAKGDTLYVGGNGPGNYSNIQAAIYNANPGDTVFVYDDSSPYYDNVVVDKSIKLIGEDKFTTVIDGNMIGDVVSVTADSVNISGFTVQNSEEYVFAGIKVESSSNTMVCNNILSNNGRGIFVKELSDNTTITKNTFENCWRGIMLISENNTVIGNSYIYDNESGVGIHLYLGSDNNSICKNNISSCWSGIWVDSNNNTVFDNIVFYTSNGIRVLWEATENNISYNTISKNSNGIEFRKNSYSTIYHNNIINNHQGIFFEKARHNTVKGNTLSNNDIGMRLMESSNNNIILDNTFNNNGISFDVSSVIQENVTDNWINGKPLVYLKGESNKVIDNAGQVIIVDCDHINIQNSEVSNATVGIWLFNSDYCLISNNIISNNEIGVYLYFSSKNEIFRNNFIHNSWRHANFVVDYRNAHSNRWYSNYWSNRIGFLLKPILGLIKTPFTYSVLGDDVDIYRPGFNFDWFPAQEPYDIGV